MGHLRAAGGQEGAIVNYSSRSTGEGGGEDDGLLPFNGRTGWLLLNCSDCECHQLRRFGFDLSIAQIRSLA